MYVYVYTHTMEIQRSQQLWVSKESVIVGLLYSQKYWEELNLAVGSQNNGRFKFGGSVRDHQMYKCKYEILIGSF